MVLDPIPQSLTVHFFGSRPQPPTSPDHLEQQPVFFYISHFTTAYRCACDNIQGCKYYTKTVLGALMEKPDFVSMVDFTLYPYGNGKLTGESIQCQHGEKECVGNTILACMQEEYPITSDSTGFVPAFVCMEGENGVPKDDFKKCAFTHNLDFDTVMTCANGPKGKALALAAARNTEALNPPHEYAPWLTLNGAPMRDDAYDLQKNVCAAFDSGDEAVSGLCSVASLKAIGKKDRAMLHDGGGRGFSVCHMDAWAR